MVDSEQTKTARYQYFWQLRALEKISQRETVDATTAKTKIAEMLKPGSPLLG